MHQVPCIAPSNYSCSTPCFLFSGDPDHASHSQHSGGLEPEHSESLALKRAKLIAGVTQAHLHLLVCDRKHDHSAMLGVLKAALLEDGYSVTTEQAWNRACMKPSSTCSKPKAAGW